jgi:hypothetical protein
VDLPIDSMVIFHSYVIFDPNTSPTSWIFCWALEPWKLQIFAASNDIPVGNPGGGTSQLGQAAFFFFRVAMFAMTKFLMCSMTNPRDGL